MRAAEPQRDAHGIAPRPDPTQNGRLRTARIRRKNSPTDEMPPRLGGGAVCRARARRERECEREHERDRESDRAHARLAIAAHRAPVHNLCAPRET